MYFKHEEPSVIPQTLKYSDIYWIRMTNWTIRSLKHRYNKQLFTHRLVNP
ncbi:MAG: hypothetical protein K0Q95_62 [Bacteroidota bacterium]|jgi:hypothetical protein|nr:hypothetical protein [Bacteroidota bacterium]